MTRGLIAVTGATGAVGTRLTTRLAEQGVRQRLVVRDASRAGRHAGAEVREASGYSAGEQMRAALDGADALFLIPASEAPDRVKQHESAVDAARAAGIGRIVYLSSIGAAPEATFTFARDHWHTEEHIRAAGVRFTFLRMNLYMDFIPAMVGSDGVIRGPAGEGRLAAVLRDDVAASAAAVLTSEGHDGRTYDLTGPESFSLREAADLIARFTATCVRYEDESDEAALQSRAAGGAADWEVRGWVSSYQAIRDGAFAQATSCVRDLTGRDPVSLTEYLRSRER